MRLKFSRCAVALLCMSMPGIAFQERPVVPPDPGRRSDTTLPNGKSQRDEILKAEHAQNIKDAAELADLAQQLQQDLEKNDRFVLSLSTLKKTEDIEKLAKKIRTRLRRD